MNVNNLLNHLTINKKINTDDPPLARFNDYRSIYLLVD